MKIIRASQGNAPFYAILEGESVFPLRGLPYEALERDGRCLRLAQVRLLAPAEPSKIVAVGLNYLDHIREMNDPNPEEPVIFLKPPTAVVGPEEAIVAPPRSSRVDYEAELAAVIGRPCRNIQAQEADAYIFGYTCMNDVTARDLQPVDGQWTRAKGFDTACPLRPRIQTELNWRDARISFSLNGENVPEASGTTANLIHGIPEQIAAISSYATLLPGDVILTGTPHASGSLKPGDEAVVSVEGIGSLRNVVVQG